MLSLETMTALVAVADTGSFSAAAERLGQTPSGVSRSIARLEAQLGMTLMTRTTRRLDLTEEGHWLLQKAKKILADICDTEEQLVARLAQPSGLVRINAATPTLDHLLAPLVADFLDAYPLIRLELVSGETYVDLIEERADIALRIGPLSDSSLHARRLGSSRLRLVAAPHYLARHGEPASVADLARHRLLGFTAPASLNTWPLLTSNTGSDEASTMTEGYPIEATVHASNGETLRHLAVQGAGIVCLSDFLTMADRAHGRLKPVLPALSLPWSQPVWAVFYKQEAIPPRVAVLLDFLMTRLPLDQV
ncbi:LysR family transcriptional regulator [Undibacterium sp. TS12]|uniref:LysR family transcriptional regulator n=1 Tax=Undibacterium sp. TS12 TaxID=2908202 RepID=UPI001F4CCC3B|nr:LysR family transcriptional regulator [Undibacterium sp. TS12]MCH8620471.1 LysR family transcriptional regulator [Undibacterium sp. TS12]